MKRFVSLLLALVLLLSLSLAAAEGPKFVTLREWLDAKGECGDCMLVLKIKEVLNPVLAVVADETASVNMYTGGKDAILFDFSEHEADNFCNGWIFVISNPRYNEFEGTIELADWKLERFMPDAAD